MDSSISYCATTEASLFMGIADQLYNQVHLSLPQVRESETVTYVNLSDP